jgi:hypothetical protein
MGKMLRSQRKRENWHIVLTESDIDWRWDMQWLFLEWSSKLPDSLQDLNREKLIELAISESSKLTLIWGGELEITEDLSLKDAHELYIEIQKEISRRLYSLINRRWNL